MGGIRSARRKSGVELRLRQGSRAFSLDRVGTVFLDRRSQGQGGWIRLLARGREGGRPSPVRQRFSQDRRNDAEVFSQRSNEPGVVFEMISGGWQQESPPLSERWRTI